MIQIPYLLVFFILFFFSFPQKIPLKNTKLYTSRNLYLSDGFFAFLMFYIIVLFIGGRWYVGYDCTNYEIAFDMAPTFWALDSNKITEFFKSTGMEKGYCWFMILFKSLINNFWCFSFINALIDYSIFYICLNEYLTKYKGISFLFLYVFIADSHLGINMIRNLRSVMLFLYSLRFIQKEKFIKYLVINTLGFFFHVSSIVYIPLYFILNKNFSKKLFYLIYVSGLIVFFFKLKWISILLEPLANGDFGRISHLVLMYSDKSSVFGNSGKITIGFLERFISFILLMKFKDRIEEKYKYGSIFINMAFIYFCLFFFFNEMFIFVQRLPPLFLVSYCFIFPMIYSFLSKTQKSYFFTCIFIYMSLRILKGNSNIHYLYNNILTPIKPDRFDRIQEIITAEMKVL